MKWLPWVARVTAAGVAGWYAAKGEWLFAGAWVLALLGVEVAAAWTRRRWQAAAWHLAEGSSDPIGSLAAADVLRKASLAELREYKAWVNDHGHADMPGTPAIVRRVRAAFHGEETDET
jgi:hypothetical protein